MGIIEPTQGATGGGGTVLSPPRLIKSITTSAPPGSPSAGDAYIVPVGATGAWSGKDNDIAQWSGSEWTYLNAAESWFAYVDDEDNYYLYTGAVWVQISVSGAPGAHASSHEDGGSDEVAIEALPTAGALGTSPVSQGDGSVAMTAVTCDWSEAQIYYFGKGGNDSNDGKNVAKRFLTIGAAITAANAQTPSASNRFSIVCTDAGIYTEDVTLIQYVAINAPDATLIGTLNMASDSMAVFAAITPAADANAVNCNITAGDTAHLRAKKIVVTSTGGFVAGIQINSGILQFDVDTISATGDAGQATAIHASGVNAKGQGSNKYIQEEDYYAVSAESGSKLYLQLQDMNLVDAGYGFRWGGEGSRLIVQAGRIYDSGIQNGHAIEEGVLATDNKALFIINEIDCNVAYNVASKANMYLFVGKLSGTETNTSTGEVKVTKAGTPPTHAASHENGGADEISVAGLSGVLADAQTPSSHASSHENGGVDEISVAGLSGTLADAQTPSSHATSHKNGGTDEIATETAGASLIPKAKAATGKLDIGWMPDAVVGGMNYQGAWDATLNTPTLADGTGTKGHYYVVRTGGTQDLGSGSLTFNAGDWVVHNGYIWEKMDHTDQVTSVHGRIGAVASAVGDYNTNQIDAKVLGTPTYDSMQDLINILLGWGLISGGVITDAGGGQINVSLARCIAKITDTEITDTISFELAAQSGVALTDGVVNYISVDYNAGTPQLQVDTTGADIWAHDHVYIGSVFRDGSTLHIDNVGSQLTNFNTRLLRKDAERVGLSAERVSGIVIGSSGLNLSLTAGVYYLGFARKTSGTWDTSGADDFSYWYNDGSWQEVTAQSAINNTQYNDYGTGLATLSNNKYGVHWVFECFDAAHRHVVYGVGDYTLSEALDADVPANLPPIVADYSFIVGKVIVQKSAATVDAQAPWNGTFSFETATSHDALSDVTPDQHHAQNHAASHEPGGGDAMAVDAAAGTGSLRTLGTGAQQATAGNDSRLSDSRTPSGAAGGDLSGTYPNPSVDDMTLNPAPTSDHTANGLKTTDTVGENVVFGDLLYMKSDGKYWKADADQASLMPGVVMALETILADAAGALLHKGYVRDDTWSWTPGDILYAGNTAGSLQVPAPSGSGDQVQIVGYAVTADIIFFNPQLVMVEVV